MAWESIEDEVNAETDKVVEAIINLYSDGKVVLSNGNEIEIYNFNQNNETTDKITFSISTHKRRDVTMKIILSDHGATTGVKYLFDIGSPRGTVSTATLKSLMLDAFKQHMGALLRELNLDNEITRIDENVKSTKKSGLLSCVVTIVVIVIILVIIGMIRG